jgi:hypothetical protein
MAREPVDVELAALRAQVETLRVELGVMMAERDSARARAAALEQVCVDFHTILNRHAPAPKTDIEAAAAEFVARVTGGR